MLRLTLKPIQAFHIVISPEMRGATCFIVVSNCPWEGLNLWVKNVYARCTLPRSKISAAHAPIRIREIIVRLLGQTLLSLCRSTTTRCRLEWLHDIAARILASTRALQTAQRPGTATSVEPIR